MFRASRGRISTPFMLSVSKSPACGEIVSEPLLGEIRFQWWRDAFDGAGDAKANPVAAALLDTIARFDLPKAPLLELISARGRDLYGDPMQSVEALEILYKGDMLESFPPCRADPRRRGTCREFSTLPSMPGLPMGLPG